MTEFEKIKSTIRWMMRSNYDRKNRKRLKNYNFTLLSSNCTGGIIYHALNLPFYSPTINVFFEAKDYIKFLKDPKKYLHGDLSVIDTTKYLYPLIKCEDIIIHAVHYKNLEEFQKKWLSRGERIQWDNIYVIMSERDGCTYDEIKEFDSLPYLNKVIFVHKPMPEIKSAFYIPGTEIENQEIQPLTSYIKRWSSMRYIDLFDYVEFFNTGNIKLS